MIRPLLIMVLIFELTASPLLASNLNPLTWFARKSKVSTENHYILNFVNESAELNGVSVDIVSKTQDYKLKVKSIHDPNAGVEIVDCNDLDSILSSQDLGTKSRVGVGATVGIVVAVIFTGGIAILLTGGAIGGGVAYGTDGYSPESFCSQ